jgi:hypothetical protein
MSGNGRDTGQDTAIPPGAAHADDGGYAKLSNDFIRRGINAHLSGDAVKVYLALNHAARRTTGSSYPTRPTLSRWSGVPCKRISAITATLEAHGLIERKWVRMGGKPRRWYRVTPPDMWPDVRTSCAVCDKRPDDRPSCLRDEITGRLLGRRKDTTATANMCPDDRPSRNMRADDRTTRTPGKSDGSASLMCPDDRPSLMCPDDRTTNHSEQELTIRETDGARSLAPPDGAASLRAPDPDGTADGNGIGRNGYEVFKATWPTRLGTMPGGLPAVIDRNRTEAQKRELFAKYGGGNNAS